MIKSLKYAGIVLFLLISLVVYVNLSAYSKLSSDKLVSLDVKNDEFQESVVSVVFTIPEGFDIVQGSESSDAESATFETNGKSITWKSPMLIPPKTVRNFKFKAEDIGAKNFDVLSKVKLTNGTVSEQVVEYAMI